MSTPLPDQDLLLAQEGVPALTPVTRADRRSARSRAFAAARDRRALAIAVAPRHLWQAWFLASAFGVKLLRLVRHRMKTLLRCKLILFPSSARFIEALRSQRRLRTLELLESAPRPLPYDVGYDVRLEVFSFRDSTGKVTVAHPVTRMNGIDIPAYLQNGLRTKPRGPLLDGSVELRPEARGGWCYYDSALGTSSWFPPGNAREPYQVDLLEWHLPSAMPPKLDECIALNSLNQTRWCSMFLDTSNDVLLMHYDSGAVRKGPWISLRTQAGEVFFANLVTRVTRWLPPYRWMDGWVYRRPAIADYHYDMDQHPFSHIDEGTSLTRAPPVASYGRRSVEGGAPYFHERGFPQYPPDSFDTRVTYPLEARTTRVDADLQLLASTVEHDGTSLACTDSHDAGSESGADDALSPDDDVLPLEYATPSRSFTGIEGKWRACGIIERAWIRYALDEMWDEGSHLTVTAQRAQDEGYDNMMPPYRFWVPSAAWSP